MKQLLVKWGVALVTLAGGVAAGWWLIGSLGIAAFVGECRGHKQAQEVITAPVVAPPTKMEEKAKEKIVPDVDVKAIEPGKKERKRIAEEYHRPDLAKPPADKPLRIKCVTKGCAEAEADVIAHRNETQAAEILGERELPLMPDGGKALITLEPDGRVEITTVANPDPFFEWESGFEVGAVYGKGLSGETRWRGWVAVEPFSLGRFHARLEVGAEGRAGQTDPYIMGGGVFRGRYRD